MPTTLISPVDLAARLGSDLAVVDCRYDLADESWGHAQYVASHIPGAVYAGLGHDLAGTRSGLNGRHPLPTPEALVETFSRLGIGPDTQLVAYDQDTGMYASRLWWLLRYMGHEAVVVLDGGWARWVADGYPTRPGVESRARAAFAGAPRPDLVLSVDEVAARLNDPSLVLIDARAPERFEGRIEPIDRVPAHIPGAVNHHYKLNLTDEGVMRSAAELRATFEALLGHHSADDAVAYCGSGVTACHNLLAMEHAGLSGAKLYPGSWSEWSSDAARPVETGPERKR